MIKCEFCNSVFAKRNLKYLQNHILHCKDNPNRIPYACKCGRKFDIKYAYMGHKSACGIKRPKKMNTNTQKKQFRESQKEQFL